ncbi:HPr family phosphocarrier protein [Geomicrobium sp. JCM 19039]|uniref:HPr family phosphocarrier protein n=1 Tax=Geomicrobium sp. JCM 19039 TaxID=1460636 RepID=UPI00045F3B9D|nr:HPr family phosphocarrier protein [Geomicrobium sp. JCM 19039]GAK12065.1 hypothetical protein JCM19039_1794 [Geomicrobium sp. JCM 19039]
MREAQIITIQLDENQTIFELSHCLSRYKSEVFVKKRVGGALYDVNLKSVLGLINLQLKNDDVVTVYAIGHDSREAVEAAVDFLS